MCIGSTPSVSAAPAIIASTSSNEASQNADIEARLRRRRAGAAANVLTGPLGIPSASSKLGATS